MKITASSWAAGMVLAAGLVAALPASATYVTFEPVASVSGFSSTAYSLVGGTPSLSFSQAVTSVYLNDYGAPTTRFSGVNTISEVVNSAGVVTSVTTQAYTISNYAKSFSVEFTLSAMSVATFDAKLLAGIWSKASGSVSGQSISQANSDYAVSTSSMASMSISGPGFNANATAQDSTQSVSASGYATESGSSVSGSGLAHNDTSSGDTWGVVNLTGQAKTASLSFLNLTGGTLTGKLTFNTYLSTTTYSAPITSQVPEAGATALSLAGLSVVGLVALRRRRAA